MINERVNRLIKEISKGNKRSFSMKIGVSATVVENIVGKRGSKPSFDILEKIILSIENINSDWLMTGRGSMFHDEQPVVPVAAPIITDSSESTIYYKMYEKKDEENKALIEQIGILKHTVQMLEEKIVGLQQNIRPDMEYGAVKDSGGSIRPRKKGVAGSESARFAGQE